MFDVINIYGLQSAFIITTVVPVYASFRKYICGNKLVWFEDDYTVWR